MIEGLKDKQNYIAGTVVCLVAIPLSIALAIASGGEPMMGLMAAIYGPFIQGILGGSSYNILGPAAALANILNASAVTYGWEIIPYLAIGGGLISLLTVKISDHKSFDELERQGAVLEGFTIAVAIVIGFAQLNFILGLVGLKKHPQFHNNLLETFKNAGDAKATEWICFLCFFLPLVILSQRKPKPGQKRPPWIIFAAIIGVIFGYVSHHWYPKITPRLLKDQYPDMKESKIYDFTYLEAWGEIPISAIIIGSLKVSFVAVFETIISAIIAQDKYTAMNRASTPLGEEPPQPMPFTRSPEVLGLSLGNLVSGVLGGMPCTGVLVRTGVNIEYGGESRAS